MGRHNYPKHQKRETLAERYDVDYVYLPQCPELAQIIVPPMKTIYRNLACAPYADETHVVKTFDDRYLALVEAQY